MFRRIRFNSDKKFLTKWDNQTNYIVPLFFLNKNYS